MTPRSKATRSRLYRPSAADRSALRRGAAANANQELDERDRAPRQNPEAHAPGNPHERPRRAIACQSRSRPRRGR
jgi:hypothetical protein